MITSNQNPEIKLVRSLEKRKYREQEKLFVIEGIRIIEDALADRAEFFKVFYSPALQENARGIQLLQRLQQKGIPEILITERLFKEIAGTETPQGILAIVRQPECSLTDLFVQKRLYKHIIMINGVQDPGNLGTILRTAAAAGWAGAILTKGTVDLYNPKSLRATMGAVLKFPIYKADNYNSLWDQLKVAGYQIVATGLQANKWYYDVNFTKPTVLVVGNEGHGVEEEILEKADCLIKIPMAPDAESLNVAIAAGVLIFEGVRQNLLTVI